MADDDDEIDYAELIEGFSLEEAIVCCSDVGIDASSGDFGLDVVKAALRNRYCPTDLTPAEVFAEIDSEAKGVLTVPQVLGVLAVWGGRHAYTPADQQVLGTLAACVHAALQALPFGRTLTEGAARTEKL